MRNAEATRERILGAALAEFSAYGIAGARVDRIAQAAKCNKNLIYIYFQDKETLFSTVLSKHILRVHEAYPFTPEDLPGYAARVFNFAMENPDLMRLLAWSALEQKPGAERAASLNAKVAALTEAQKAGQVGTVFPPEFILVAIMSLATAWSQTSPFGLLINPKAADCKTAVRKNVVDAVRLLTNAAKASRTPERGKT